jgi:hypothetical protein
MKKDNDFVLRVLRLVWRKWSDAVWLGYYGMARLSSANRTGFAVDRVYARNHFLIGHIAPQVRAAAARIFQDAPTMPYRKEDYARGYRWSYNFDEAKFNKASLCYDISGEWRAILARIIDDIAPSVSAAYGSPWRVVNVRAYSTLGKATSVFEGGPNTWHSDRFNSAILKALVYLTPINARAGATEARLPDGSTYVTEGDAGTYLIFDPTKLIHRGLPPQEGQRDTIEFTFAASRRLEKEPVIAGQNAVYPWLPWTRFQPH